MLQYSISKRFEFSASHVLRSLQGKYLPDGREHPCARPHGHNYVIEVELASEQLDEHGMVLDYHLLQPLKQYLDEVLDHRHLNDALNLADPTAEAMARHLYAVCIHLWPRLLAAVSVEETPRTRASVRRVTLPVAAPTAVTTGGSSATVAVDPMETHDT